MKCGWLNLNLRLQTFIDSTESLDDEMNPFNKVASTCSFFIFLFSFPKIWSKMFLERNVMVDFLKWGGRINDRLFLRKMFDRYYR